MLELPFRRRRSTWWCRSTRCTGWPTSRPRWPADRPRDPTDGPVVVQQVCAGPRRASSRSPCRCAPTSGGGRPSPASRRPSCTSTRSPTRSSRRPPGCPSIELTVERRGVGLRLAGGVLPLVHRGLRRLDRTAARRTRRRRLGGRGGRRLPGGGRRGPGCSGSSSCTRSDPCRAARAGRPAPDRLTRPIRASRGHRQAAPEPAGASGRARRPCRSRRCRLRGSTARGTAPPRSR